MLSPFQLSASASSADAIDQTLAAKMAPVWSSPFVVGGRGTQLTNAPSVAGDGAGRVQFTPLGLALGVAGALVLAWAIARK